MSGALGNLPIRSEIPAGWASTGPGPDQGTLREPSRRAPQCGPLQQRPRTRCSLWGRPRCIRNHMDRMELVPPPPLHIHPGQSSGVGSCQRASGTDPKYAQRDADDAAAGGGRTPACAAAVAQRRRSHPPGYHQGREDGAVHARTACGVVGRGTRSYHGTAERGRGPGPDLERGSPL